MSLATTTRSQKKGANGQNVEDQLIIIGRWRISNPIGQGKGIWIHNGIDIINRKVVTLKFISHGAKASFPQQLARSQEIHVLRRLRHKNIVRLFAYNLNVPYFKNGVNLCKERTESGPMQCILLVLEHASNGSLYNLLHRTSGLNENVSRTFFKQIISAIHFCHNKGVIHRDLRPENILINKNYDLKINNFGNAKMIKADSDFLMKTKIMTARSYQAPEILENGSLYDFRCDIFSIGVILFLLLAGC